MSEAGLKKLPLQCEFHEHKSCWVLRTAESPRTVAGTQSSLSTSAEEGSTELTCLSARSWQWNSSYNITKHLKLSLTYNIFVYSRVRDSKLMWKEKSLLLKAIPVVWDKAWIEAEILWIIMPSPMESLYLRYNCGIAYKYYLNESVHIVITECITLHWNCPHIHPSPQVDSELSEVEGRESF